MKKQLFILLLATSFVAEGTFSQEDAKKDNILKHFKKKEISQNDKSREMVSRPAKSNNFYWDNFNTNDWFNTDSTYYTYDAQGYETVRLNRTMGLDNSRTTTTYNANHQVVLVVDDQFNFGTSTLEPIYRTTYTYDLQGNRTEYINENYNYTTSSWEISYGSKDMYSYDANNNIIEQISQEYNQTSQLFENTNKTISSYNASNLVTTMEEFSWDGSAWSKDVKYELQYTGGVASLYTLSEWNGTSYVNSMRYVNIVWENWNDNIEESDIRSYTEQTWNGSTWINSARNNTSYDEFGGSISTDEVYSNNTWTFSFRYSNFFDSHLNYSGSKSEEYINGAWEINYQSEVINTYDANDNITQTIWKYWNQETSQLVNNNRKDYADFTTYSNSIGLVENQNEISVNIYPNPSKEICHVSFVENDNYNFQLISLEGKTIKEVKTNKSFSFNSNELKSGIYIYKISKQAGNSQVGKLIIE